MQLLKRGKYNYQRVYVLKLLCAHELSVNQ